MAILELFFMLRAFRLCPDWFRKFYRATGPIVIVTFFMVRCIPFVIAEVMQAQVNWKLRNDIVQFRTVFAANIGESLFFGVACWRTFMDSRIAIDRINLAVSLISCTIATLLAVGALIGGNVHPGYRILLLETFVLFDSAQTTTRSILTWRGVQIHKNIRERAPNKTTDAPQLIFYHDTNAQPKRPSTASIPKKLLTGGSDDSRQLYADSIKDIKEAEVKGMEKEGGKVYADSVVETWPSCRPGIPPSYFPRASDSKQGRFAENKKESTRKTEDSRRKVTEAAEKDYDASKNDHNKRIIPNYHPTPVN
ncbi:MAG: hypothetical protein Q9217_002671 [Psora testacea]